jgi:hypothetical protein
MKEGKSKVVFNDFTAPPHKSIISAAKLEKLCRGDILGYVIQINALIQVDVVSKVNTDHPDV